jgi:3-hydroxybutyryl-CoA dehydrogenase
MGADIRTVGVVGAGTMGAGIAQLALEAGHDVWLHDLDPSALDRAAMRVRDGLGRRAARLGLDAEATDDWVAGRVTRLRSTVSLGAAAGSADLVIEAANEDLDRKQAIFRDLDRVSPPGAILATNTSALSVAAIAAATHRPARVAGLHFFNPAPVMTLVEVVSTPATDPSTTEVLAALMLRWGRVPVRSADSPGFIVNRVNRPFTLEALAELEAGGSTADAVDRAFRAAGYPMGPFELMDLIGLDVNLAVARALHAAALAADDPLADRFKPSALQERLVAAGRLGRKTGAGFYEGGRPDLGAADAPADRDDAASAVVERVELAIIDEAYRALGEGVATEADIDTALRLGAGHPIGPFERAARMGGPNAVLERLTPLAGCGPRFVPAPPLLASTA